MLEKDFFSILDLPKKYDICKFNLEKKYFALSKTTKDQPLLNNAYQILKDDYKRANLLYTLNNSDKLKNKVPSNFLETVIEYEDKIESADLNELHELKKEIENRINECKLNYNNGEYLNKWRYFLRLEEFINKRVEEYE